MRKVGGRVPGGGEGGGEGLSDFISIDEEINEFALDLESKLILGKKIT